MKLRKYWGGEALGVQKVITGIRINKPGQEQAWGNGQFACVHLLWHAAAAAAESWRGDCMSLYGTKVHFCLCWQRRAGASVTHTYSSVRQKENILSNLQKHRSPLSTHTHTHTGSSSETAWSEITQTHTVQSGVECEAASTGFTQFNFRSVTVWADFGFIF